MNFALTLPKLIVVETSVPGNDNNPFQDYMYPHPDDHTTRFTWSIGQKRLTILSDTQIFFAGSWGSVIGGSSNLDIWLEHHYGIK